MYISNTLYTFIALEPSTDVATINWYVLSRVSRDTMEDVSRS